MQTKSIHISPTESQAEQWFDGLVSDLSFDKQLHKLDILDPERKKVYDDMITGNNFSIHEFANTKTQQFFIGNLLNEYINELLVTHKKQPLKLGLELSDSKILVWAEIENEDEETEDALILSQAKVNAKYEKYGFYISSTIVEEEDRMNLPNHYKLLKFPE